MKIEQDLLYTREHEWVRDKGKDLFEIGITDYAQSALGDIVFIEMPEVGHVYNSGEEIADVESVKSASPVYSPVSGEVSEVNSVLETSPEMLNSEPYSSWICRLKNVVIDKQSLMNPQQYEIYLSTLK